MNQLYPHHLGHYLGMDTHDTMLINRNTLLAPGMVVTIEPGVYVPLGYSPSGTAKLAKEYVLTRVILVQWEGNNDTPGFF